MSEQVNFKTETTNTPETNIDHNERPNERETAKPTHEKPQDTIDSILRNVNQLSRSSEQLKKQSSLQEKPIRTTGSLVSSDLKSTNFKKSVKRIQRDLPSYQRPFSKLIHNNTVDRLSEAGAKTVARPSGLLLGGVTAFLVSTTVFIACKYYGYEYNYYVGLVSFPVGFALGILGEFITKAIRTRIK